MSVRFGIVSVRSNSLFCHMILSEKSATFRDHAPACAKNRDGGFSISRAGARRDPAGLRRKGFLYQARRAL